MKRSNRLILLIGVFLAVVAFVLIVLLLSSRENDGRPGGAATPEPPQDTVIATQDIPLGATITEAMVTTEKKDPAARDAGALQDVSQAIGKTVRQDVTSGEQITTFTFGEAGPTQFEVPAGQRAMAVQVDALSGVGTAIQAGDYVDMVLGLSADAFPVVQVSPTDNSVQVVAGLNSTSVKLLIEGMQVLSTIRQAAPPPASGAEPSPSGPSEPEVSETSTALIILSVTPQQTELVKFAQMQGSITLVLRSPKDFFDENGQAVLPVPAGTTGVVLRTLTDNYGVLRPEFVEAILPEQ